MGSACIFSPSQPHLLASLSKGGELALLDTRCLPSSTAGKSDAAAGLVARQRVAGPVFGCKWLPAGAFGCCGEQLAVVGADSVVRLYDSSALGEAPLDEPLELPVPGGYGGRLLALAISSGSSSALRIATAGEPEPADQIALPTAHHRPAVAVAPAAVSAPASAAAVAAAAVRRRRRQKSGAVALDALAGDDGMFGGLSIGGGGGQEEEREEEEQQHQHQSIHESVLSVRAPVYVFEQIVEE